LSSVKSFLPRPRPAAVQLCPNPLPSGVPSLVREWRSEPLRPASASVREWALRPRSEERSRAAGPRGLELFVERGRTLLERRSSSWWSSRRRLGGDVETRSFEPPPGGPPAAARGDDTARISRGLGAKANGRDPINRRALYPSRLRGRCGRALRPPFYNGRPQARLVAMSDAAPNPFSAPTSAPRCRALAATARGSLVGPTPSPSARPGLLEGARWVGWLAVERALGPSMADSTTAGSPGSPRGRARRRSRFAGRRLAFWRAAIAGKHLGVDSVATPCSGGTVRRAPHVPGPPSEPGRRPHLLRVSLRDAGRRPPQAGRLSPPLRAPAPRLAPGPLFAPPSSSDTFPLTRPPNLTLRVDHVCSQPSGAGAAVRRPRKARSTPGSARPR